MRHHDDISKRLSTLSSECPEQIRRSVIDALSSQIPCDGGLFFTCTTVDDQRYYTDITPHDEDAHFCRAFEQLNGNPVLDAAWLPSKLDPNTVDTFVCLREYYGEESYETTEVVKEVYLPLEIGDNLRALFLDGDELLGWVGLMRRGLSERFSQSERNALQSAVPAIKAAVAAADAAHNQVFGDSMCATFAPDGRLRHASDPCARWLDADKRHALRRWVRDFDSGCNTTPIRLLGDAEVRLVRMDGASGVRYLITVDRAQHMRVDPWQWLTDRQRDIAQLAICGATSQEIADHLQISRETVRTHLKNIYRRLGIGSRTELVRRLGPE